MTTFAGVVVAYAAESRGNLLLGGGTNLLFIYMVGIDKCFGVTNSRVEKRTLPLAEMTMSDKSAGP
jgi:hypothetical protein